MIKTLAFVVFVITFILLGTSAWAQASCVCTAGCKIASDPYVTGTGQPTSCTVYKAGVAIASGAVVASSTIPLNNNTVCLPASPTYVPGPASNVACLVTIPAQAAGNVTVTMTASNGAGESAQSAGYTFQSVSALPTVPQVPVNPRVTP